MTTFQDAAADALRDPDEDGAELALWRERATRLQHSLDSRIVVEQAKGVLAKRFGCELDVAFNVLRHASRNTRQNVRELAAEVVAVPVTPAAVAGSFKALRSRRGRV